MTEENWIPEVGRLIVRILIDVYSTTQMSLAYADDAKRPFHHLTIMEVYGANAHASFQPWTDNLETPQGMTGSGSFVVRRYATEDDIHTIFKLWDEARSAGGDWGKQVKELPILREDEKRRLRVALQTVLRSRQ